MRRWCGEERCGRRRPLVPGHRVAQAVFWTFCPSQKAPPLRGAGLVQLRLRFCQPRPQLALHTDHSVHVDHPPFTGRTEKDWGQGVGGFLRHAGPGARAGRHRAYGCAGGKPWRGGHALPTAPGQCLLHSPFCQRVLRAFREASPDCSSQALWLTPQPFTGATPAHPGSAQGTTSHPGLPFLDSLCPLISLCTMPHAHK